MSKKALKVGITGGIGSGKTTICRIFETLGIPIYYADDRAKALMTEDGDLVKAVKNLFGGAAYLPDGTLNRALISQIAFSNPLKLNELNALVHPAVQLDGERWHNAQVGVPYTLKEAALHFESGGYKLMDKMICVVAPKEVRIERVLLRGGLTHADIEARMSKQLPDEKKIEKSDFVIYNDGQEGLIQQVMAIHKKVISDK
ncbi:MAG: dephospho-CoA kinase [Saprospiraceae bacterium]|nr:dephospho-CoA kinase [Saprospiraceae bacterium]